MYIFSLQLYEQFIDRSTDLGNLFVAFGNAELSNKMASYTADHKMSVKKTFTLPVVLVMLCRDNVHSFPARVPHSRDTRISTSYR